MSATWNKEIKMSLQVTLESKESRNISLWTDEGINAAAENCGLGVDKTEELFELYADFKRAHNDCQKLAAINPLLATRYIEQLFETEELLDRKAKKILGNYAH
jgi:hypothetical protein